MRPLWLFYPDDKLKKFLTKPLVSCISMVYAASNNPHLPRLPLIMYTFKQVQPAAALPKVTLQKYFILSSTSELNLHLQINRQEAS